jgi:hypothetical protein
MQSQRSLSISERLAKIYEGNARVHLKAYRKRNRVKQEPASEWSTPEMLAASGFAIAGSYWSLTNPRKAVSAFRNASDLYRSRGQSFSLVLGLASEPETLLPWLWTSTIETQLSDGLSLAFGMVCLSFSDDERFDLHRERFREHFENERSIPIGRLGIPLDYYARCAHAMYFARTRRDAELLLTEATTYVNRASEVLRIASLDRFHWSRFQSRILPAEPEVIAMVRAMSVIFHDVFRLPMTKLAGIDDYGRHLIEIGEKIRKAARKPRYRKQVRPQ